MNKTRILGKYFGRFSLARNRVKYYTGKVTVTDDVAVWNVYG